MIQGTWARIWYWDLRALGYSPCCAWQLGAMHWSRHSWGDVRYAVSWDLRWQWHGVNVLAGMTPTALSLVKVQLLDPMLID